MGRLVPALRAHSKQSKAGCAIGSAGKARLCMHTLHRRRARSRILNTKRRSMSQQAETDVAQRCAPTPVGHPLRVRHHGGAAALAIVISTRPPAGDRQVDVRPTIQLLTSLRINAPELYATARVLLLATDDAELAALKPQAGEVLLRSFATALRERSSNASFADVHRMPEARPLAALHRGHSQVWKIFCAMVPSGALSSVRMAPRSP